MSGSQSLCFPSPPAVWFYVFDTNETSQWKFDARHMVGMEGGRGKGEGFLGCVFFSAKRLAYSCRDGPCLPRTCTFHPFWPSLSGRGKKGKQNVMQKSTKWFNLEKPLFHLAWGTTTSNQPSPQPPPLWPWIKRQKLKINDLATWSMFSDMCVHLGLHTAICINVVCLPRSTFSFSSCDGHTLVLLCVCDVLIGQIGNWYLTTPLPTPPKEKKTARFGDLIQAGAHPCHLINAGLAETSRMW